MGLQACVLSFAVRSGVGTQTVSGVVDADGAPFVGKFFLFQSGYAVINTVTHGAAIPLNAYMDAHGASYGAIGSGGRGSASVCADVDASFKDVAGGETGGYSVVDFTAQPSFGGFFQRLAYVSAVASGSFTLTYDQNDRTGDSVLVTILGGDDFTVDDMDLTNGVHVTTAKPQALLVPPTPGMAGSLSSANSTGGRNYSWGWDTRDSERGASATKIFLLGTNVGMQVTDCIALALNADGTAFDSTPIVSAWNDLALTTSGNTPDFIGTAAWSLGGDTLRSAAGALTQPLTTGIQTFDTGIDAKWIMFVSAGTVASPDPHNPEASTTVGWGDRQLEQAGFWSGERAEPFVHGARYLSDATVLRFAVPDGSSTTFTAVASLASLGSDGTASLNWTTVDSTPRQILWLALGDGIVPPPPPPEPVFRTREVVRRRLRRAPIVWNEKGGLQTRVRINLFAVDMQPGVGTSDTPDPLVMIRASKDGGFTWGNERRLTAGRVGEFFNRINAWQWGHGRDWVFEVSCTDPVLWNLVGAYFDAEGGEN